MVFISIKGSDARSSIATPEFWRFKSLSIKSPSWVKLETVVSSMVIPKKDISEKMILMW